MMDFETFSHLEVLQDSSDGWMLNVGIIVGMLDSRIGNPRLMFKEWRQIAAADIAIFVDRRGEGGAAGFFKPHRIICPLYTSDAADQRSSVDFGGRRYIKKQKQTNTILSRLSKQQYN